MNRVRTYRIARNMISAEFYVILGLIDDLEIESNKVAHGIDHADIRWRLSLHSSKRWAYNFRTNVLFCWSRLSIDEKDAILEHMKDRYGVSVGRFDDSGPGYVKERSFAASILQVASELLPRITATFTRTPKIEERDLSAIQMEVQRFVGTLRKNEDLECFVTRRDDDKVMEITIGFTDHESMKGIVDGMKTMLKKLGKRSGIDVNVTVKTEEKSLEI
jgi:hypothetical protein